VAARKVSSLLEAGALVEVVAPDLGPELRTQQEGGCAWRWTSRPFTAEDAAGCLLVIAATDDREVNRAVAEAAHTQGGLVNVVDDPAASDFHVPGVVRRGPLQLTVTTGGLAPGISARLRRRLEGLFPEEWAEAVSVVGEARKEALARRSDPEARRALVRALADLDIERLLAEGGLTRVKEAVETCTSRLSA
jgi:precorrin-2 dehydrogenase/sirohydrochlorin ferrochelatase